MIHAVCPCVFTLGKFKNMFAPESSTGWSLIKAVDSLFLKAVDSLALEKTVPCQQWAFLSCRRSPGSAWV